MSENLPKRQGAALKARIEAEFIVLEGRRRERSAGLAVFEAMCAARPLKPPPMPRQPQARTRAEVEAAQLQRADRYRLATWRDGMAREAGE